MATERDQTADDNVTVCPGCWHETCTGECESIEDRTTRENRAWAQNVAAQITSDRRTHD